MRVDYLATSDPCWKDLLGRVSHDVYHLPEYLDVSAVYEGSEEAFATAFYAHDGESFCLIPLLVRTLPARLGAPPEWRDVTSPYGYAAPLFHGDETWADKAMQVFAEESRARQVVSAFIRLHPLLPASSALARSGELVKHGETVYVDLSLSEATLWSQTRGRLRSYISGLKRAGFHTRFDDWSSYEHFVRVYGQTMARLEADQFYQFPEEYFRDLRTALGNKLHLCSVFDANGTFACGALMTATQGIVQYHLSGTADEFIASSPSKLMINEITLWAKRNGHQLLHLGGGLRGQADSLLHFKAGFSSLRSEFLTYRLVCDPEKYDALCRDLQSFTSETNNYFPRYRMTGVSESEQTRAVR